MGPFCSYLPTTIHKYLIWIKCNIRCLVEICHFPLFDFWKKRKGDFFSITRILWNGIGLLKRKTPPCLYSYRLSLWKRFWSSANYLWYFMIRNSPFLGSNRQTQTCTKKNMKREPRRQKWWFLHYIEPRKRDLIYRTPLNWIYTWDLFFFWLTCIYLPTSWKELRNRPEIFLSESLQYQLNNTQKKAACTRQEIRKVDRLFRYHEAKYTRI